ncbi:hypothetical protein E2C01_004967 [Portunus trituberculatus]|uniref:Uncharacterized protein n=1 Tax=Portunus trituberculatus TaxID=210409 RepID=A0A5B7CSR8_PORTR|nr:hypothetical protein [Portunus trituberculatus]
MLLCLCLDDSTSSGTEITATPSSGSTDGDLSTVLFKLNSNMFGLLVTLLKSPLVWMVKHQVTKPQGVEQQPHSITNIHPQLLPHPSQHCPEAAHPENIFISKDNLDEYLKSAYLFQPL